MDKRKEIVINRFKKLQSLIPATIKAIRELPEFDFFTLSNVDDPGELQIDIANYNYVQYLQLRRAIAKCYTYQRHWFHPTLGSFFIEMKHKNLDITLNIQLKISKDEGNVCKLVIDHYTKPEPVYRVECK